MALMANWDLEGLAGDLPQLSAPLTLLVPERDGFVPPARQREAAALVPGARTVTLRGLGHLAHEEAPEGVAQAVRAALNDPAADD